MIRYLVRRGDTLSAIAERFGTTVDAIMRANNLRDPDIIFAGQILFIPVEAPEEEEPRPPRPPRPPVPRRPTVTRTFDGVEYTMSLNKREYRMGESIIIRLRKKNILSVPLTLTYRTAQKVDFRVTQDSKLIWQWSRNQFFAQVVTSDTLQPGEEKVYRVVWDQRTDDMLVRPGTYTITGWNLATPSIRLRLEFTVRRNGTHKSGENNTMETEM